MSMSDATELVSQVAAAPSRGAFHRLLRKPLAVSSLTVIALVTLAVALADVVAPYSPLKPDLALGLSGPSSSHLLGTDELGRDLLSRLLFGGRPALVAVALSATTFLLVGTALGILCGYLGGWTDRIISVFIDAVMSAPAVIIVLAVLAIFDQNILMAMIVFGMLASGNLARIVRGACLSLREEDFIAAAKVCGLTQTRIMGRHVLPSIVGPVVVQLALFAGTALSVQTGLGFLGLGFRPPEPSWGGMVGEAAVVMGRSGWMLFVTGGVIALMVVALGLLGDGVRDATADRRKSSGVYWASTRHGLRRPRAHAAPSDEARLELEDYSVGFSNGKDVTRVVTEISFSVGRGEIVGLVGESGSGKTVTALSVLGLLPDNGVVLGGGVWLGGVSITGLDENGFRAIRGRRIGLVSQEPMVALDPMFTVGSQLAEVVRHARDIRRADVHEECIRLLERVNLPTPEAILDLYPHQLSGGMAQRVVIAIALAGNPTFLIADEPTTALDVTVQAEILDLLRNLAVDSRMGVLLVTHDLGVVADLCQRAVIMSGGRIVEEGTVEDLFYRAEHDYTRRLIRSTPSLLEAS